MVSLRKHKNQYSGLSPYSVWILVGIVLFGLKIEPKQAFTQKNKKWSYVFKLPQGGFLNQPLHPSAVNALVGKSCLLINKDQLAFSITNIGFKIAYKRLISAGLKIPLSEIASNLRSNNIGWVILKTEEEIKTEIKEDTSVFIG